VLNVVSWPLSRQQVARPRIPSKSSKGITDNSAELTCNQNTHFHSHLTAKTHCPLVCPTATASMTRAPVFARSHKSKNCLLLSVTIWRGFSTGVKDSSD